MPITESARDGRFHGVMGNCRNIQLESPSLEGPRPSGPPGPMQSKGQSPQPEPQQPRKPPPRDPGFWGERSPLKWLPPLNPRPGDAFHPDNLVMAPIVSLDLSWKEKSAQWPLKLAGWESWS
ncbi:formin-like protein 16 [Cebus imitator]|uniref:formin-like protein 16 n=1 Tax=Cebus imitator TaxID=2715852 RepID=UPI00080A0F3C|nr:formin-like protein 16 [Cebus imitator]